MDTPSPPLLNRTRWVRGLDCLQVSLLLLALFLLVPSLAGTWFQRMTAWYLLPSASLASAVLLLPRAGRDAVLAGRLWRLRVSALLGLGFAPFIYWVRNAGGEIYLLAGALLAVLSFFWYLGEQAALFELLAARAGEPVLQRRAARVRKAMLYLGAVPVISLHLSFVLWPLLMPRYTFGDLAGLWLNPPLPFVLVMGLPPASLVLYIGTLRHGVLRWPERTWRDVDRAE